MITLITGSPGAGKSAACVSMLVELAASGRPIYVNGIPELDLPHELLEHPEKWHEPGVVPDGALIVIDEVQRVWRPAGSGQKVPPDIAALETHRHRGLDFIVLTQGPHLVHSNVRALCGRHIHLRDVGLLGRWWYEWPEVTDTGRFRTAPVKKRYKLPKRVFDRYKSASLHVKPVRSVPPVVILAIGGFVVLLGLVWYAYRSISSKVVPGKPLESAAPGASVPGRGSAPVAVPSALMTRARPSMADPLAGYGVHLVGQVNDERSFSVTAPHLGGRPVAYLKGSELLAAGYSLSFVAPCVVRLTRGEVERWVLCDQPAWGGGAAGARAEAVRAPVAASAPV